MHEKLVDPNGRTIPLIVRMKLDLVGVRIHLADWRALEKSYREFLIAAPVNSGGQYLTIETLYPVYWRKRGEGKQSRSRRPKWIIPAG